MGWLCKLCQDTEGQNIFAVPFQYSILFYHTGSSHVDHCPCSCSITEQSEYKGKRNLSNYDFPAMCNITGIVFYDFLVTVCAGWSGKSRYLCDLTSHPRLVSECMGCKICNYNRVGLEMDRLQYGVLSCRAAEY